MKKNNRLLCALAVLSMVVTLCACGRISFPPNQWQSGIAQSFIQTTEDTEMRTTEAPSETITGCTTIAETAHEDMKQDSTTTDVELKGIIYIDRGLRFKDNPTSSVDTMVYYGDVTVNVLDPETGATRMIRSFPVEAYDSDVKTTAPIEYYDGYTYSFDRNYESLALEVYMPDHSRHVGWLDERGNFTDVTALTTVPGGDWSGTVAQYQPYFDPEGFFCFHEKNNLRRVPVDDLRPETVEDVAQEIKQYPDGAVRVGTSTGQVCYASEQMTFGFEPRATSELISIGQMDWVNDTDFVFVSKRNEAGVNHQYTLRRMNQGGEPQYLTPFVQGRWSYNPVVSPDGTQIVFLSSLRSAADKTAYVYTVSTDGGTPTLLDTELSFFCRDIERHFVDWR